MTGRQKEKSRMKAQRGVWPGLMGLMSSLFMGGEAGASTFVKFSHLGGNFEPLSSCRLCLNPETRVSAPAIASEKSLKPQDKAAPLGPAIEVGSEVKSSLPPSQQTTIESIQVKQKPRQRRDLGLLDKFKPKFSEGVEIIYRLDKP